MFIVNSPGSISKVNVSDFLTKTFKLANVWDDDEYNVVCCTRLRVSVVSWGCALNDLDPEMMAKHFLKNRAETTAIHYNLFANHKEMIKISMQIGKMFHIGGNEIDANMDQVFEKPFHS